MGELCCGKGGGDVVIDICFGKEVTGFGKEGLECRVPVLPTLV